MGKRESKSSRGSSGGNHSDIVDLRRKSVIMTKTSGPTTDMADGNFAPDDSYKIASPPTFPGGRFRFPRLHGRGALRCKSTKSQSPCRFHHSELAVIKMFIFSDGKNPGSSNTDGKVTDHYQPASRISQNRAILGCRGIASTPSEV